VTAASFAVTDQYHAHPFRQDQYVVPEIQAAQGYTKMTRRPLDSQALLQEPQRAPPVGRAVRILLGLVLMVYVIPVYFRVPVPLTAEVFLLMLGVTGVYCVIHIVVSRQIAFGPCLGAVAALGLLVELYVAGASRFPILGHGKGELAAVTFLGISLVVAGLRAAPGCELMAIPSLIFRQHTELTCLIFSPLDSLEYKLRSKRGL